MDGKDELPLYLPGFRSGLGRASVRALPQILIKGDMSTETSAPRLRLHITLEPGRWMKAFGAHPCLSVEVVVQHTRVDSTQSAPALMTTIVFPLR